MGLIVRCCICLLVFLGGSFGLAQERPENVLYYLNIPESITKPGTLSNFNIKPNQQVRVFLHYCNATSKTIPFVVNINHDVVMLAEAFSINNDPVVAGISAAKDFLGHNPLKKQFINSPILLKPGQTISGVFECIGKVDTFVMVFMGNADRHVDHAKNIVLPFFKKKETVDFTLGHTLTYRIGDPKEKIDLPGSYGVNYEFKVYSLLVPIKIKVYASGRGGPVRVPYLLNGKLSVTETLKPREEYLLFEKTIYPNETLTFETMPVGGFCYPLQITFKV